MITEVRSSSNETILIECSEVIRSLYEGILGRPPDSEGLETYTLALRKGVNLSDIVTQLLDSDEYRDAHQSALPGVNELPDLTKLYPDYYIRSDGRSSIFIGKSDNDINFMEELIKKHRYYDSFGVWSPKIDRDKHVTAAIVQGLGANSCLELGCYTGPVLSLLATRNIEVCGVDVSHVACLLAYPNVRDKIRFGDLLCLQVDKSYDVVLGMDILEHLNPLSLDSYIRRIAGILSPAGFVYINSPMFGRDDVFGTVFDTYLPEWREAGEDCFWRHMHCDGKGWPMHGHLVWASPSWWERLFLRHGLVRERRLELAIHSMLGDFFDQSAPARRSLFVLRSPNFTPKIELIIENLTHTISAALAA